MSTIYIFDKDIKAAINANDQGYGSAKKVADPPCGILEPRRQVGVALRRFRAQVHLSRRCCLFPGTGALLSTSLMEAQWGPGLVISCLGDAGEDGSSTSA